MTFTDHYLRDHFLISMPHLHDRAFSQTVTYICDHSEYGAMGLVINKSTEISVNTLLNEVAIETEDNIILSDKSVLTGGPVQTDRGFVLHTGNQAWSSSIALPNDINITTSKDILESLTTDNAPNDYLLTLGYAGWSAGQLEGELAENAWLTIEADHELLFHTPIEKRWEMAIKKLGINISQLSSFTGHA